MKIYISGKMSGVPNFNASAFNNAERRLRTIGHTPINPLALDALHGDTYTEEKATGVWESRHRNEYLRRDIMMLADKREGIEAIYMLKGWTDSKGARLECTVAEGLGLKVYYEGLLEPLTEHSWESTSKPIGSNGSKGRSWRQAVFEYTARALESQTILDKAKRLVHGDRGESYGHPLDDFTRTARAASALGFRFQPPGGELRELSAEEIPILMMCVKLSREINKPGPHNLEDIAGYAETKHMVAQERAKRGTF